MSIVSRLVKLVPEEYQFNPDTDFIITPKPKTIYFDLGANKHKYRNDVASIVDVNKLNEMMAIVRRAVPGLIATELVGVQPTVMTDYPNDGFISTLTTLIQETKIKNTSTAILKDVDFIPTESEFSRYEPYRQSELVIQPVRKHIADLPLLRLKTRYDWDESQIIYNPERTIIDWN